MRLIWQCMISFIETVLSGAQLLAAYIMIILLLLYALCYPNNIPVFRHTVLPHTFAGMVAESDNPYWSHKIIIV